MLIRQILPFIIIHSFVCRLHRFCTNAIIHNFVWRLRRFSFTKALVLVEPSGWLNSYDTEKRSEHTRHPLPGTSSVPSLHVFPNSCAPGTSSSGRRNNVASPALDRLTHQERRFSRTRRLRHDVSRRHVLAFSVADK